MLRFLLQIYCNLDVVDAPLLVFFQETGKLLYKIVCVKMCICSFSLARKQTIFFFKYFNTSLMFHTKLKNKTFILTNNFSSVKFIRKLSKEKLKLLFTAHFDRWLQRRLVV